MDDMLTGISSDYLYFHGKKPKRVSDFHSPYFLAFAPQGRDINSSRADLLKKIEEEKSDSSPLSKIESIGEIENYRSFWDFDKTLKAFKVFTKKSYFVPEVSDHLFFYQNLYTGEHDIPYQQRALADLAASNKTWIYDSKGAKKNLNVLVYDIETTEFQKGSDNVPIDIIGYSNFDVKFESSKSLKTEEFSFDIIDLPQSWEEPEIVQLVSRNVDEEIDNLSDFCKIVMENDIISGHNIIGFDNFQIYNRLNWIIKTYNERLKSDTRKVFQEFLSKYSKPDKSFHFGTSSDSVQFYPANLDTYLGARKFYSFLNEFSLKAVAPFLGVEIKDRLILTPDQIKIDDRTLKYNKHDVMEQLGVTLNLVQQALPLSFTTCLPFDMLLSSGAVYMWDHMSMIRASVQKKIMPPICRVLSITQVLSKYFKGCNSTTDIVRKAKDRKEQLSKDFVRAIKYGDEMPYWMNDPNVIYNENHKDSDDILNYHMPGGMTIKPDKDADSHFVPWWYVVVADVGAMYPTILKAMNIGGDTVRLAKKSEKPDDYIWLKRVSKKFLDKREIHYREVTDEDSFADKGYIIGVKIDDKPGVVNCAMTGIMSMIAKTKKELKEANKRNDKSELQRLKMMYQSVKGARNAGSVDYSQRIILVNPEGKYENLKIGEFVDRSIDKFGCFSEKINGTEFEIANIKDDWKAISINKEGKVEIKEIKQAVRHKWNERLIKIWTKSGFTVVTPNHSVFTIRDGEIREISAGEIQEDTLLVHAKKIPNIEKNQKINLINTITQSDYYGFIEKEDLQHFNGLKNDLVTINTKGNTSTSYLKVPLRKLKEINIPDELLEYITIGSNGRKSSRIKSSIDINEDFAEFLGYYISEGHISKRIRNKNPFYYITISSASENMHNRFKELSNKIFGVQPYILDRRESTGAIVSTVHAKVINHIFEEIIRCGRDSRSKQIPSQLLSSSNSVKKSFLKAYMEGDGNVKFEMPNSCPLGRFTTNSKYLNEDLITIQKQFGIKTNTYFRDREKTYNTRMVNFYKGKKEKLEDCYALPPKKIEFVEPSSEYVYDLSVEDNENFLDANGGMLLHNTHGIMSAPGVSGRQFNLWGAATITTKGQAILADSLDYLKNKGIRVVYGDSVGSETSIILKEKKLIKIVEIKDLFEECKGTSYKKGDHEYKELSDVKCLSVTKEGVCEWKKADFVKRHPYSQNIVEVKTQRGKISVTKNHSLYTVSDGLKELPCDQIKPIITNIAHISKYDNKGLKIKINALKPLLDFDNELNIWLNISINQDTKRLLNHHQPRNNSKGNVSPSRFIRMKMSDAIDLHKKGIIKEIDLKHSFISSYNGKGKIPVIYDLDEDFARVLGAYVAEGSIYVRRRKGMTREGCHIFICGHNFKTLRELKQILDEKFGKSFKITSAGFDKNGKNFRIQGNPSTAYLFKFVLDCGQGSQGKKVSPYLLSTYKNVQKAFIDEYIKGDGHFDNRRRVNSLLEINSKSKKLVEGLSLIGLNLKYGYPSVYYRKEKSCYSLRFVKYNLHSVKHKNLTGLPAKETIEIKPKDGYVYDISVQDNNNFVCANGLIPAHNTDGIYLGCSRSVGNIPKLAEALELTVSENEKDWITKPDDAINAIEECNLKWQKELNYPDFELEPENHDAMIFVKHKNYLIFDTKNGKIELITKGNNFKGSDKANIARKVLKQIMIEVLRENPSWENEEDARKNIKNCILEKTGEILSDLDLKEVDLKDLTLIQSVQPAKRYKPNQNGSLSTFGKRALALEKLLGKPIRSRMKFRFVVTKRSLPGINNPSKSGVKPIDFMYPVEKLESPSQIDLDWYKKMIENYIQGAFGISGVATTEQTGLDAWM